MPRTSAGVLPYLVTDDGQIEVFIAHMGGPLWARKDERAWSIVKGEHGPDEEPRACAMREFAEETGTGLPEGEWLDLGEVRQSGGKVVHAYAVAATAELALVASNEFEMEWPPRSGRRQCFPEVDRAQWCTVDVARVRLVAAQAAFLDRLVATLSEPPA